MTSETSKTEVGSYFVSNYPPFSQWRPEFVPEAISAIQSPGSDAPLGLYLHIPFCRKRCKFCYFKVYTDKNANEIETYVSALSKEIELVSQQDIIQNREFRFVYFGGGTPSYLSSKQLLSLNDRLQQYISWDTAEEVTFECEPGTLQEGKVKTLKEIGVTRLSLGIENFSDEVLEENGRAHLSKEVFKSWEWIEAANFDSVNIDLIAGMVGETWENWEDNINKTVELNPDSVTIYQMELPFNTVYSKDILGNEIETPVADWETKRKWVDYAFTQLANQGYQLSSAYTMVKADKKVSFAYRDHLWQGSDLLATGVASFGHVSGVHYQNHPELEGYLQAVNDGNLPITRALKPTKHQLLIREMILQLKKGHIDAGYFRKKYGEEILDVFKSTFDEYVEESFMSINGDTVRVSREGLLRIDGLIQEFFEEEFQGVRYT